MQPSIREPVTTEYVTFRQVGSQGFGDRYNSWAWSMLWWNNKLYVGTNRSWLCTERAAINAAFPMFRAFPFVKYPPEDPDAGCPKDPLDLPLRAEIWCWTPETDSWTRLYQSPADVPIPGKPSRYVARDIGYRYMATFVERDGTEALYVAGVSAEFIYQNLPPPRLLRSVDGIHFAPVPQDAGTFLGDLAGASFRSLVSYQGRLFALAGIIYGDGVLLEATDPAAGNNAFRQVSPPGMRIFEILPYNGYLYLGVRDTEEGYAVLRADVSGEPPYEFIPVVTRGAFLDKPSQSVLSMCVYKGRLYVGTDRPAELIRINPDDSWDLVMGTPRKTPDGWKYPISGLDAGFGSWLNGHLWRMHVDGERLYIGTMNMATHFRTVPKVEPVLETNFGVDLFVTSDGWNFVPVTVTGFGDKFNFGVRSFASTPYGMFIGTANSWYGLQIWRSHSVSNTPPEHSSATPPGPEEADLSKREELRSIQNEAVLPYSASIPGLAPMELEVEPSDGALLLHWSCHHQAKQFRIWRAHVRDERTRIETNPFLAALLKIVRRVIPRRSEAFLPPLPDSVWVPGAYHSIGTTKEHFFRDQTAKAGQRYIYYVQAEDAQGNVSGPSNLAAGPSLAPLPTFAHLLQQLPPEESSLIRREVLQAQSAATNGDITDAIHRMSELLNTVEQYAGDDQLFLDNLRIQLAKVHRRLCLSQQGVIPTQLL